MSAFLSRRDPHEMNWTALWGKNTSKGKTEDIEKQSTPHAAKSQGVIAGVVLPDKMTKWNQKLEVRKAQQEQDFRAAKEAKQGETTQWLLLRAPQRQHVSKRNTCGCFCHLTW